MSSEALLERERPKAPTQKLLGIDKKKEQREQVPSCDLILQKPYRSGTLPTLLCAFGGS